METENEEPLLGKVAPLPPSPQTSLPSLIPTFLPLPHLIPSSFFQKTPHEFSPYDYQSTLPKILLETITARTATLVLALTYIIFFLGLSFDVYTTIQGFNGENVELLSTSCAEQNIIVGVTEGNYGCTRYDNSSSTSPTLTWIGHAQDFTNVISVSVKAKLSNTSSIFYNGSYIDDDEILDGLTFQYDLDLYCCYTDTDCGSVESQLEGVSGKEDVTRNENNNNGWKKVISIKERKVHIDKYLSLGDDHSTAVTFLSNTFQNQESLPSEGKVKSYLVYIHYDKDYFAYQAWSSLSYTLRDISRPNTPIVDNLLPVLICLTCVLFIGYVYCLATVNQKKDQLSINSTLLYDILPEQRWLIYYLIAVICFQNPIYCIVSRLENPSAAAVYSCYVLDALSEATLITIWLLFSDGLSRQMGNIWTFYLPKMMVGICVFGVNIVVLTLQFPSINPRDHRSPVEAVSNWSEKTKMVFVVFSITLLLMMWYWTIWWFHSIYRTASALQKLPYMTTRYLQLSFRFFSLQATLVTLYFTIENLIVIYYISQNTGWSQGTIENITDNINTLFRSQTLAFGKIIFLTTYGLILAFFFLPTKTFDASGYLLSSVNSLAVTFVISEEELPIVRKKRKHDIQKLIALREFTAAKADIFCVNLGIEFASLATESYNDVKGLSTASAFGSDFDIDRLGYVLIDYFYDTQHEAVCYIARHKVRKRVVVFFRGTSSRQHWTDNLNFTQRQIDLFDLRLTELDLVDGLEIPGEENHAVPKFDSESDSDDDIDDERDGIHSNQFMRNSSGGYELVGGGPGSGLSETASSEGGSYFPSTNSINQGFMKSKASIVETARNVEGGLKRAAHTITDATTGLLMTAASHTPILQYAVNTYVHSGFWEIYLTVRGFIHSSLRKELSRSPAKVFFVGHSMAGALASFAAVDFSLHSLPRISRYLKFCERKEPLDQFSPIDEASLSLEHPPRGGRHVRVGLYTYGSPRVGNWSFSHLLDRVVPNSFRVVVDGDIVTGIPKGNYKHVGTEILVDSSGVGTIIIDPSFVESRLQKSNKTSVEAHSMQSYRRGLLGVKEATEYNRHQKDRDQLLEERGRP